MKVLIDMNLSTERVAPLVGNGHDAVHWATIGADDAGDDELFAWAIAKTSVILTNDLDFGIELVTRGLAKPSVIQLRSSDLRPSTPGQAVLAAIEAYAEEIERGVLVTVDPSRARLRLLDLGGEDAE